MSELLGPGHRGLLSQKGHLALSSLGDPEGMEECGAWGTEVGGPTGADAHPFHGFTLIQYPHPISHRDFVGGQVGVQEE